MFKHKLNYLLPSAFAMLPLLATADDLDIYAGETVEVSAPVELVFAVDTSTSMACSTSESFIFDQDDCYESFYGSGAGSSKADIVQNVLTDLFENTDVLPDAVRVGLAYYNEPGGSIVRPISELSTSTGVAQYPTHRSLLINEIDAFIPGGSTPILGTLLEIGQYLTGERVISGRSRKGSPYVSTDSTGWSREYSAQTFGEVARISNESTIVPGTGVYQADASCRTAISSDPVTGAFNSSCSSEAIANSGLNVVTYNEDINTASVCSASADSEDTTVTTQIVLITDGLPTSEQMSMPMHDSRMGTWVKRFVTGDGAETGFLAAGEGALPIDADLPEEARFADFGCPVTANVNTERDEDEIMQRLNIINNHPVGAPPTRDYLIATAWLNNERGKLSKANIIPGDIINTAANYSASGDLYVNSSNDAGLTPLDRTVPNFDTQRSYYESCLFNVALRFRELGVKVHVIGFGLDGDGVDNSLLQKITQITDGQWIATSDASTLATFFESIASSSIQSSAVRATMSPSVSVNPGSILSNSDEVYFPMFKAGANNFLYGNLKKYRLETDTETSGDSIAATRIVDANGAEATETCDVVNDIGETVGQYSCFRSTSESFWSDEVDGAIVTKGGAASKLGVFGLDPDGDRRIYIQNGNDLDSLQLISVTGSDSDTMDNEGNTSPDDSAYLVDIANPATRNLYAQLVPVPEYPRSTFSSYAALSAHPDEADLKLYAPAYDMVRWLIGFDERRFDSDGIYSPILSGQEDGLNERGLLVDGSGESLSPSLRAILDDDSSTDAEIENSDLAKSRLYYGAIIHSQPTVVNYSYREVNDEYEYDNVLFVSGNDGFLRVLDAETGEEQSSFFPEVLIPNIPAMFEMRQGSLVYGLDATWTPWRQDLPVDGVFDGKISGKSGAFAADNGGFVRLYGGMRRGGRSYFFFDMTDRQRPQLLTELQGGDVTDRVDPFARLGQTWSQPTLAKIKIDGSVAAVAVFGGGYDPDYDFDEPGEARGACADRVAVDDYPARTITCGNQVYVVKAGSHSTREAGSDIGDVVWWASNTGESGPGYSQVETMNHSIPMQIKTIDYDGDGLTDRLYFADMGGQVFRVNVDHSGDTSTFEVTRLATFGLEDVPEAGVADNRVFFETPSVALMNDGRTRYIGVALVSGWREKPKDRIVNDEMYYIKDTLNLESESSWDLLRRPPSLAEAGEPGFIAPLETIDAQDFNNSKGFSVSLQLEGEKGFGSPLILFGNVFWPSYIPPTSQEVSASLNSCNPPPQRSRVSFVRVQNGARELVYNNDGTITSIDSTQLPEVNHAEAELSVPLSGLGVHVGGDAVSILSGTKAIRLSVGNQAVRKTKWRQDKRGRDAIPSNPVSR